MKNKRLWTGVAIVGVMGLFLLLVAPVLFFRLLSLLGLLLLILSAATMLLTFRKARRLSTAALWISMATSLLAFMIYRAILPPLTGGGIIIVALLAGGMLGVAWASATEVYCENGVVKRRGNAWYLAVWALIFSLTQLSAVFWGRPPRWSMVMLAIGTGVAMGNSLGLLFSIRRMRKQPIASR